MVVADGVRVMGVVGWVLLIVTERNVFQFRQRESAINPSQKTPFTESIHSFLLLWK